IESENLLANVNEVGQYLANKLRGLSSIKTVRAYGLWQGIELDTELLTQQGQTLPAAGLAPKVVAKALDYGYIINATDENTLRLATPLIINKYHTDPLISDLHNIIAETVADANKLNGTLGAAAGPSHPTIFS